MVRAVILIREASRLRLRGRILVRVACNVPTVESHFPTKLYTFCTKVVTAIAIRGSAIYAASNAAIFINSIRTYSAKVISNQKKFIIDIFTIFLSFSSIRNLSTFFDS